MRCVVFVLAAGIFALAAPPPESFHFAIVGDRTGEPVAGIYERTLREATAEHPAFMVTTGDSIQGLNDENADSEWRRVSQIMAPYRGIAIYLTPGNHDIWSELSEKLYREYAGHPLHYSFDYAQAHFTILDNSRSDELSPGELAFLERDLKAHADKPVKFIVSHRPSWILHVMLRDPGFPLHQLALKYGVRYVIAGHVHQLLHLEMDGVTYLSMPSSGGHLRASGKYEDGWFFGYAAVQIRNREAVFRIHEINGKESGLKDWGAAGLVGK